MPATQAPRAPPPRRRSADDGPYDCEFCDIIVMQGRKVRTKPPEQGITELEAIRAVGGDAVFFTDDNFVGNPKRLSELLDHILAYRRQSGFAPHLFTQATVTLAERPALLAKMVEAGFTRVFLGIGRGAPRHVEPLRALRARGRRAAAGFRPGGGATRATTRARAGGAQA